MSGDRLIMLPCDPGFHEILASTPPPDWREVRDRSHGEFQFVVRAGGALLEAVPWHETLEYLHGGEWDDREAELEAEELEDPDGWLIGGV